MNWQRTDPRIFGVVLIALISLPIFAGAQTRAPDPAGLNLIPVLWRDPGDISSLNLLYGPGGKEHEPTGKFTFVKEDLKGTSPKYDLVDEQGVRWRAKVGEEAQPETAATRLIWAVGYFADEDYYLADLRVEGMPKPKRGSRFVSEDGVIHAVRLERKLKGQKKAGNWNWFRNPFTGTKELNGLRIMMALVNNWDLKEVNNAIYQEKDQPPHYAISDIGASFGRTGNSLTRTKNNLKDYEASKFIEKTMPDSVDFALSSRPFFLTVVNLPNYATRSHMEAVVRQIPRADAKWLGQMLGRLSDEQIGDCFRASGYSPEEVDIFTRIVQGRIAELKAL
jgi:hypothetical protein